MQPRNPYLCLTIVVALAVAGLVGLVGMMGLTYAGREVPQAAVAIVSGAFGSLASFLVSVPRGSAGGDGNNDKSIGH